MENNVNLEKLFKEAKGKPIKVKGKTLVSMDRFEMPLKKMTLEFTFEETNSKWKQGFIVKTKGEFILNNMPKIKNAVVFWEDTAPKNIRIDVNSKDGILLIYNVWDTGDGITQAWHNGAAIEIKKSKNKNLYYCNDGYPNFDFNDLIFSMHWE